MLLGDGARSSRVGAKLKDVNPADIGTFYEREMRYALTQHGSLLIPAQALYGGIGAALAIGAAAGLYPSMRAAHLSTTEALRTV